jgi:tetratricopeptide (TPR) repeat protein
MTTSVKIGSVVAVVSVGLAGLVVYFAGSYLLGMQKGIQLANEGYAANMSGDREKAIARLTAALKEPLPAYQRAYIYLNRGAAYNSQWRFDAAIQDFTEALRLNSKLADAYNGRGYAWHWKSRMDKAIADLTEAIRLDPNSNSAYYNRGLIYYKQGKIDQAIADLNEAVRCDPESADPLITRGLCYVAKNDLDRALSNFDGAIAVDPTSEKAYLDRADVYGRKGESAKRMKDLAEAQRLNPGDQQLKGLSKATVYQAKTAGTLGKSWTGKFELNYFDAFDEAKAAYDAGNFDRAIELNDYLMTRNIGPARASVAVMNRGNAYQAKDELDKALRDYDEAVTLDPANAGAYVNRASILSIRGESDDAIKDLDAALSLDPQQWQAYFNRSIEFRKQGRVKEAFADLDKVMDLNPQFIGTYINRGALYVQQGEMDKAIRDYDKAITMDPTSAAGYAARAFARARKKDYAAASADMKKVTEIEFKRGDPQSLNSLAWFRATSAEAAVRDGPKAVDAAMKACELSHWQKWAYVDTLAAAYAETGDFDNAVKYQKKALEMNKTADAHRTGAEQRLKLYQEHKPYRDKTNR